MQNKRGIAFKHIFSSTDDAYLLNSDDETWNDDNCVHILSVLVVALVFADYSIAITDSQWMDLSDRFRAEYDDLMLSTKFDVDINEDGEIAESEEQTSGQTFMRR